jgi:hypothetical protein
MSSMASPEPTDVVASLGSGWSSLAAGRDRVMDDIEFRLADDDR